MKALIIVDVQNDFVEGGSLGVDGGKAVASRLAEWLKNGGFDEYDQIVTTQDWHIDPGNHFADEPDFVDTWPHHCVADTFGAEIVEELAQVLEGKVDLPVFKGRYEAAYSGFEGRVEPYEQMDGLNFLPLGKALKALDVDEVDIVGIATDYCVRETCLDAAKLGLKVTMLNDFVAGINAEKIKETVEVDFPAAGVKVK